MPGQQVLDEFAGRLGRSLEDGSFQMLPLTRDLSNLSAVDEPVPQGYLRYSRKGIVLYADASAAFFSRDHLM